MRRATSSPASIICKRTDWVSHAGPRVPAILARRPASELRDSVFDMFDILDRFGVGRIADLPISRIDYDAAWTIPPGVVPRTDVA